MNYLIFDVEAVADYERVVATTNAVPQRIQTPDGATRTETVVECGARVLAELCERERAKTGDCVIPPKYVKPVVVVMLLVTEALEYQGHRIVVSSPTDAGLVAREFWGLYNSALQAGPTTLVSFNGLRYDGPVMEVAGLAHGCDLSRWIDFYAKSWTDPRGRYGTSAHIDLFNVLSPGGNMASLHYWSRLIGLPGKLDTVGDQVPTLLGQVGGVDRVVDYCICDVLNTYGLLTHLLFCQRRAKDNWRGPVFGDVLAKMTDGRGDEAQKYVAFCKAGDLF